MSVKITQKVSAKCDGPKCLTYDRNVCPAVLTWDQDDPQENPDAYLQIPDGAYRIIIRMDFLGNKKTFLSKQCERDYLRDWVPPFSPRELADMQAAQPKTEVQTREATIQGVENVSNRGSEPSDGGTGASDSKQGA